ncbi:Nif3-like dinuclear metal center hexameric protein [Mobilicoccus massiliensis]|uniref:Nif3-like dinuclear metal center hexameric protein n=1 Tax=Mobilicoccus massiliensis TaxID=1522310 RepID=UPI00058C1397|nr:Nif3-like dinuclear metal center hexameric protein [Mobilicoccus massiliensis]
MQTVTLRQVLEVLEGFYPHDSAQSWDRVGLTTGDPEQPVRRVHYAVDPTLAVVEEARDAGADLLVTHHPLLLRGVHSVATTTAKGATVTALVVADIALFTAHTNADVAWPGVCDALGAACGLDELETLTVSEGADLGRVGNLPEAISLGDLARRLVSRLPATAGGIRVSGPPAAPVRRIAVLGGAGDSLFDAVRACDADVYVTSDLRHHPALEAREEARGRTPYLVDAGHYATEYLWLADVRDRLATALADLGPAGTDVEHHISELVTDPWTFTVGAVDLDDLDDLDSPT